MNGSWFQNLMSGRTTSVPGIGFRFVLRLGSLAYSLTIRIRNFLYDQGLHTVQHVSVPVVSIGNLTTGGTGKTPLVALTCQLLRESGMRPGIVSRGYRSINGEANDEKLVLKLLCPNVPHEQNPDRVAAADSLTSNGRVDAIVMDDGFQHRRLYRNLDIVLIDATNPFGYGYLLPRGLLREPLSSLRRAELVIITRSNLVSDQELAKIERTITDAAPRLLGHVLRVVFQPTSLRGLDGTTRQISDGAALPVHLMAGIGNPDAFQATAFHAGLRVTGTSWFPDHHHYSDEDLRRVQQEANSSGAASIVTTLKDLVKLSPEFHNVYALDISAVFANPRDADVLQKFIHRIRGGLSRD